MEPGDLMFFNSLLAHGVRPNHSKDKVRMAQYVSMFPAEDDEAERQERIRLWKEQEPPNRPDFRSSFWHQFGTGEYGPMQPQRNQSSSFSRE